MMNWYERYCSCDNPKANRRRRRALDLQLFAGEKTEDPTPRRRREARKKGQLARSRELSGALVLMAGIMALRYLSPEVADGVRRITVEALTRWVLTDWSVQALSDLNWHLGTTVLWALLPLFGVLIAVALLANLGQTGFSVATTPLEERLRAFNPVDGLKRLISRRSMFELAKGLVKLGGVGVTAYLVLRASGPTSLEMAGQPLSRSVGAAAGIGWDLLMKTGGVLVALAVGDYAYQRWEFERSLRMSREEVKQEMKETEGDPQLRARRRSQQRDMARSRMLSAVRGADVVVVNPTHFSVALRYEQQEHEAPLVVAKGRGHLALRIREIAKQHGVPVMEEPAVARTLYRTVEVGQYVPPDMYRAVAGILALVWRMRQRSGDIRREV